MIHTVKLVMRVLALLHQGQFEIWKVDIQDIHIKSVQKRHMRFTHLAW